MLVVELSGEVNLACELEGEVFEPLRDPVLFVTASKHPIMCTVVWDNGAGLGPEFLCDLLESQQQQHAA